MECGNVKSLSDPDEGRCIDGDGTPTRPHLISDSRGNAFSISRSETTGSSHGTPRVSRAGCRSMARGYGLGGDEFVGQIAPWTTREMERVLCPISRQSPRVVRRILDNSRDKESLLEEIIQLKKAITLQSDVIRRKNVQNSRVLCRNRQLEMDVDDLEMSLQLEGPRTGSPRRLRAKLQGLQMTLEELQDLCDTQREELMRLRRDIRITHAREVEVERDVLAEEVKRLQKALRRMEHLHNRISCENKDLDRLKYNYKKLEMANSRLKACMTATTIRPQSQPGVTRKIAQGDTERELIRSGRSQESRAGQQTPRY